LCRTSSGFPDVLRSGWTGRRGGGQGKACDFGAATSSISPRPGHGPPCPTHDQHAAAAGRIGTRAGSVEIRPGLGSGSDFGSVRRTSSGMLMAFVDEHAEARTGITGLFGVWLPASSKSTPSNPASPAMRRRSADPASCAELGMRSCPACRPAGGVCPLAAVRRRPASGGAVGRLGPKASPPRPPRPGGGDE